MSAVSTPATSPAGSTFSVELPLTPNTPHTPPPRDGESLPPQEAPMAYIVHRLHDMAPYYWKRSDSTNCAIHFPVDFQQMQQAMMRQATANVFANSSSSRESFSAGVFAGSSSLADQRRGSAPVSGSPMRVVRLHMEYLSTQSALLRGLLSGSSHLDLSSSLNTGPKNRPFAPSHTSFRFPSHQTPRLLPASTLPSVYLPIPDPTSFPLLIHYLYFGKLEYIDRALTAGEIRWEGTVRNVEYLGLGSDIKCFLGRWWAKWVERGGNGGNAEPMIMEELDDDDECMDEDDEEGFADEAPSLSFSSSDDVEEEEDVDMMTSDSDEEDERIVEQEIQAILFANADADSEAEELVEQMKRC